MNQSVVYAPKDKESVITKRRWEQIGAAGGIAFVVMQLAGQSLIQVGGAEPAFDAAAAEIEKLHIALIYYNEGDETAVSSQIRQHLP